MPLFWRYLLKNYLRVFFLSIAIFVLMLLLTRINEIARFYALSSSIINVITFICLQIPHILPWAIPISCFISAFLLFEKISQTSEMTALRVGGLSINRLMSPILCIAALLSGLNFYITSELSPISYLKSRELLIEKTSVNPIQLLKRQKLLKIKDSFVEFKKGNGGKLEDLLLIMNHKDRLALFSAKELSLAEKSILGERTSLLFTLKTNEGNCHLVIENHQSISSSADDISNFMKKSRWNFYPSTTPLRLLRIHKELHPSENSHFTYETIKRGSIALTVICFTLTGIVFGIHLDRRRRKKQIIYPILLLSMIIIAHLSAKQFKTNLNLILFIYFIPQLIVFSVNWVILKQIQKGRI